MPFVLIYPTQMRTLIFALFLTLNIVGNFAVAATADPACVAALTEGGASRNEAARSIAKSLLSLRRAKIHLNKIEIEKDRAQVEAIIAKNGLNFEDFIPLIEKHFSWAGIYDEIEAYEHLNLYWTNARLKLVFAEMQELEIPINTSTLRFDPDGKITEILKKYAIESTSRMVLSSSVARYGSLDLAVEILGFETDPLRINEKPTENDVILAIQFLASKGLSLRSTTISENATDLLKSSKLRIRSGGVLTRSVAEYFDSWSAAFSEAGFPPIPVPKQAQSVVSVPRTNESTKIWSDPIADRVLELVVAQNIPLSSTNFDADPDGKIRKIIFEVIGRDASPAGFVSWTIRRFGSWVKCLSAHGLTATKKVVDRPERMPRRNEGKEDAARPEAKFHWNQAMAQAVLTKLIESGSSLQGYYILSDPKQNIAPIIRSIVGAPVTSASLLGWTANKYGSWYKFLEANGIHSTPWARAGWNVENAQKVAAKLRSANISLNSNYVRQDPDGQIRQIIFDLLGLDASPKSLVRWAEETYGSWYVLANTKSDAAIFSSSMWTDAQAESVAKQIAARKIYLDSRYITQDPEDRVATLIFSTLGSQRTGASLVTWAENKFGSWPNYLATIKLYSGGQASAQWTAPEVSRVIAFIRLKNISLDETYVESDPERKIETAILAALGYRRSAVSLFHWALKNYGSWDAFLKQNR